MSTIYIPSLNAFHLHMPKTGGTSVHNGLKIAGIKFKYVAHMLGKKPPLHLPWAAVLKQLPAYKNSMFFCFVRHPAKWYASRYSANVSNHWRPGISKAELSYRTRSFDEFVKSSCKHRPGFYGKRVDAYVGTSEHSIDYIGKTESLIADLLRILRALGAKNLPMKKLYAMPRQNRGSHKQPLTAEHLDLIYASEKYVYDRFDYDREP
jgi:hypothetical protein